MSYRYSLLPTHNNGLDYPRKHKKIATSFISNVFLSRRYARFTLVAVFSLASFAFVVAHTQTRLWGARSDSWSHSLSRTTPDWSEYPIPQESPPIYDTRPPLYQRYTAFEDGLPQHNESLSFPDDSSRKYVFFADHTWGVGWGNVMQEMVLNAQLAYESGRTFVFDDYVWKRDAPYADYNGKLIPSRVPTSALIAGPIAGQPYSNSTIAKAHPRAVSRRYFEKVCPIPYILDPRDTLSDVGTDASALQIMSAFSEKLQSINDRCVEIQKDTSQLFDYWVMGSARLHDIMPTLIYSPIMRDLAWSPLVNYAFQKNQHHFTTLRKPSLLSAVLPFLTSRGLSISYESGSDMTPTPPVSKIESLPVLALHLRRGDFIEHCDNLYNWNSTYTGFNTQPSLPDRFFMENATMRDSMSVDEMKEAYKQKCLIDVDEVRKRVVRAVTEWRNERLQSFEKQQRNRFMAAHTGDEGVKEMLRKVYIMTNGDREFLNQLKSALLSDAQRSALRVDNKLTAEDANAKSTNGPSNQYDYDFVWSWDEISTSRDMDIGWETKYVAQAMDMYVGQRAEVFIGNGFSSLTANVVLLRTVAGVEPWRTRFW